MPKVVFVGGGCTCTSICCRLPSRQNFRARNNIEQWIRELKFLGRESDPKCVRHKWQRLSVDLLS
jgi:hypothetical protein